MTRNAWVLLLALLWASPVAAQPIDSGNITANSSGGACTAVPPACVVVTFQNQLITTITLQVSGTYTGTTAFEATSSTNPLATNAVWFAVSATNIADGSSATGTTSGQTGQFSIPNSGLMGVRVRATAAWTGTAVVSAVRGYATARWLNPFVTRLYTGDGTCPLPARSYAADTDLGAYRIGANNEGFCAGSVAAFDYNASRVNFALPAVFTQGTLTADAQALSSTATWNNAAITFTHWKAVITDTASAAGSLAVNILGGAAGSTTLFSLSKAGVGTFGSSVLSGGAVQAAGSSNFNFSGRTVIRSPSDGVVTLLNAAETDFTRLQFGTTTSAGPALSRSTTELRAVLADASVYTSFGTSYLHVNGQGRLATTADGVFRLSNEAVGRTLTLDTSGTPTCSTNCGTSPTVTGVNAAFTVTMGATGVPASGWVVTFNGTLAASPQCMVTMAKAGMAATKQALTVVTNTTTMTVVTNGAAPANGDVYTALCAIGQ